MTENEIIIKRKVSVDRRGYLRLTLPKVLGDALKLENGSDIGLIWKGSHILLCPWPEVA